MREEEAVLEDEIVVSNFFVYLFALWVLLHLFLSFVAQKVQRRYLIRLHLRQRRCLLALVAHHHELLSLDLHDAQERAVLPLVVANLVHCLHDALHKCTSTIYPVDRLILRCSLRVWQRWGCRKETTYSLGLE